MTELLFVVIVSETLTKAFFDNIRTTSAITSASVEKRSCRRRCWRLRAIDTNLKLGHTVKVNACTR